MSALAFDDHDRRVIEGYAVTSLLLAAQEAEVDIQQVCHDTGIQSVTMVSADGVRVRFSYPIWFAANGQPVSWQMEVTPAKGATVTVMTGLDAEAPRPHLVRLLIAADDPAVRPRLVTAAQAGPGEVVAALKLGTPSRRED